MPGETPPAPCWFPPRRLAAVAGRTIPTRALGVGAPKTDGLRRCPIGAPARDPEHIRGPRATSLSALPTPAAMCVLVIGGRSERVRLGSGKPQPWHDLTRSPFIGGRSSRAKSGPEAPVRKVLPIVALVLLVLVAIPAEDAYAHPGGTDSSGCHTCRTNCARWGISTGSYHCHGSARPRTGSTTPARSPTPAPAAPVAPAAPQGASNTYTVQPGDWLQAIAEKHGVSLSDILRLNPEISRTTLLIFPDQVIVLSERTESEDPPDSSARPGVEDAGTGDDYSSADAGEPSHSEDNPADSADTEAAPSRQPQAREAEQQDAAVGTAPADQPPSTRQEPEVEEESTTAGQEITVGTAPADQAPSARQEAEAEEEGTTAGQETTAGATPVDQPLPAAQEAEAEEESTAVEQDTALGTDPTDRPSTEPREAERQEVPRHLPAAPTSEGGGSDQTVLLIAVGICGAVVGIAVGVTGSWGWRRRG